MKVDGTNRRTIWPLPEHSGVTVIDQRALPHRWQLLDLRDLPSVEHAIRDMAVRGAPLIGVTAAYGLALQANRDASAAGLQAAGQRLRATRPTAVNLHWALEQIMRPLLAAPLERRAALAWTLAGDLADADVRVNEVLGRHGLALLQAIAERRPGPVRVLTHCNAGWLATVDWGTALAPVYQARRAGIDVHVWVDETRPRNQGASLTTWELGHEAVPHTLIADNAGGLLMQRGEVDIVIVGCDRVSAQGDVCNKIGTYLKALAAQDNGVPFWAAMPSSTLDLTLVDGLSQMPIEERPARELTHLTGLAADGELVEVQLAPAGTAAANPAFDVTPARLVSGLITEHGLVAARPDALHELMARQQ